MKKLIALTMALLMLAFVGVGIAEAAGAAEVRTLREGKYIVGEKDFIIKRVKASRGFRRENPLRRWLRRVIG